jgi:putative spermidine/putrescine transport system permease protein
MRDSLQKERFGRKGAASPEKAGGALLVHAAPRSKSKAWLGLIPFFVFIFAFMIIPAGSLLIGAFQRNDGHFSLVNFSKLFRPNIISSYVVTIRLSFTTALGGGLLGFFIAYGICLGGLPKGTRSFMSTFSGVASNLPVFRWPSRLFQRWGEWIGHRLFADGSGKDLYASGFNLYSFWGLALTYIYFQIL